MKRGHGGRQRSRHIGFRHLIRAQAVAFYIELLYAPVGESHLRRQWNRYTRKLNVGNVSSSNEKRPSG